MSSEYFHKGLTTVNNSESHSFIHLLKNGSVHIGIVSDSDSFIPLAITLYSQQMQVSLYYVPSQEDIINQKVHAFLQQVPISLTEEKNQGRDLYQWLQKGKMDVCFIIGYRHLIHLDRLKQVYTTLFNIHFGLLPMFKGPSPVFWQLKLGCEKIGVSIHRLSTKFDEGPVVWMKETDNQKYYNYKLATQLLSQLCMEGAFFIINCLTNGLAIPNLDRSSVIPAYYKRPGLQEVAIDWKQTDADGICNLIRACNPWNKGAIALFKGQEVKLTDAVIVHEDSEAETKNILSATAGTIVEDDGCLHICCKDGNIIQVNMLFFQESFIPTYYGRTFGFRKGDKFESIG